MARVDFNGITVDVDDATMQNPQALAQVANAVRFQHGADETTGAPADLRFAVGSATTPEDQVATLKARGYEAGAVGDALYYRDGGQSRRVNPKGLDWGDMAGAAPELAEAAGSAVGAIIGGGATLPSGPGAIAGGLAGSALGAVAGKEGAQWIGRQVFGTQDSRTGLDRLADVGTTAALGAIGEGVGQALGQGVKAARMALAPSVESQAARATADAIGLPPSASVATGGRLGRLAEDYAMNSRLGRPTMERAVQGQQQALGAEVDALTAVDANGRRMASRLGIQPDVTDQAARVFHEIPPEPRAPTGSLADWTEWKAWKNAMERATPEEQRIAARGKLRELGGGDAFDANRFVTNWEKLDPRAKHVLGKTEGVGKEINALIPVMRRAAELQTRVGKPLETPVGSVMQLLGVGGGFVAGGPVGAAAAALAPAVIGRLMTSKPFVSWLSKVPRNPGAWARHLGRLGVLASQSEEISVFHDALRSRSTGDGQRVQK